MAIRVEKRTYDDAGMRRRLADFRRDAKRLDSLRARLLERYPNEWVSVSGNRVFHAPTIEELFGQLRQAGIEPGAVPREFLSPHAPPLLL